MTVRTLFGRFLPEARTGRRAAAARFARCTLQRLEDRVNPVTNSWTGGFGLWSVPGNWSLGHVPTSAEDVAIDGSVNATHDTGTDTVLNVTLTNGATLTLAGGSLTDTTLDAPASANNHVTLQGGILAGGTVSAATTISGTTTGGTLSGVTLNGTLDLTAVDGTKATVTNGLTLGGTVLLGSGTTGTYGQLSFDGTQTLGGTGTVLLGPGFFNYLQAGPTAGTVLTIGPNIVVRGSNGTIGYSASFAGASNVRFINQGTIEGGGGFNTLTLNGTNWSNTGTVRAAGGTVTTAGTWSNSGTLKSAGDTRAIVGGTTGATQSGTTVTITTTAAHGFVVGQQVQIAGVVEAGYNGTFTISSVPTATTFTYTTIGGLPASGGGSVTLVSTLNLGGSFTSPTLGAVVNTGGTINLTGTVTNTGGTLALTPTTGSWQFLGGTITGGTVTTSGGARLVATTTGGTLAGGVTLSGTLDLGATSNVSVRVTGGLTLNNGTVQLGSATGNYGVLNFDGVQTLDGTGTVVFGNNSNGYNFLQAGPSAGSALTIGPNVVVRGHSGAVGFSPAWGGSTAVTFTNQGTINADTAGGTITLNGNGWTNTGTLQATGGGSLALQSLNFGGPAWTSSTPLSITGGGALTLQGTHWTTAGVTMNNSTVNLGDTFSMSDLGPFTRTGGTVNLTGTLQNTAATLTLDATSGSWRLAGGTIDGGTVATSGGAALIATTSGGTLDHGVTLSGTFDLTAGTNVSARVTGGLRLDNGTVRIGSNLGEYAVLAFDGGTQTLGGTGTVVFGNSSLNFLRAGPAEFSHLIIGPDVVVRGNTGQIGYHPSWGGSPDVSFSSLGTIRADTPGGTITAMNDFNYANGVLSGGTWEAVNGTLRLIGGDIITNAAAIVLDGPNSRIYSDTGTTNTDALAGFVENSGGGTFTVRNGRVFTATGRFTNDGTLDVAAGGTFVVQHQYASQVLDFSSQFQTISWSAAQALGPSNTPLYGDYPTAWAPSVANGTQEFLTLGFATPDFSDGVIIRETLGTGFVSGVDAIDTNGTTHVVWTGTDTSPPNTAADFFASWPRTNYKVQAVTIHVNTDHSPGFEEIDSVQLVGPYTGYVQDAGTTAVEAGGAMSLVAGAEYAQTSGATDVDGTVTSTRPIELRGGFLVGTGTVAADVVNDGDATTGGIVNTGLSGTIGTLTISGDYTQTAHGTLLIDVAGPGQYDRLNVAGAVTLDGVLLVNYLNGFLPVIGDGFTVLDNTGAGAISGTFAGLAEGGVLDAAGPTAFQVTYAGGSGNDVALTATNRPPTLDPIASPPAILENSGAQQIDLTGIDSGNVDPQTLSVTAVSDNPALIPNPTVTYFTPDATGSLSYTPVADKFGTAVITVTVTDSGGTANGGVDTVTRTFTVTVTAVNDPPTLDPIPDPPNIPEDAGPTTIPLSGISAGIGETQTLTVTATSSNPSLIPNPTVTYTSPNATGSLTFTPLPNQHGTAVVTVKVNDGGGTANGGIDEVTRTFTVTVDSEPDAPVLDTDPLTVLQPVAVRTKLVVTPPGTPIANFLSTATDADGDPIGLAVTGIDNAKGVWQYSTDGANWTDIPATVAANAALVLSADATTRVRFVPALRFQGFSHLSFVAWDHTDGATVGTQVDTTAAPTSYSAQTERAWVAVGRTKPVVAATGATLLPAVREDAKVSRTFVVKNLLGIAALESLPAAGLGIAVTGLGGPTGHWQYKLAKTTVWVPFDPVSTSHALLLRPTDFLRFVPATNANGSGDLAFKTWVPGAGFGTYQDTATPAAGFGIDSGAVTLPITPVNDAPVLDTTASPTLGQVNPGDPPVATTVAALGLAMTDVDNPTLGIQVLKVLGGTWEYRKAGGNWVKITRPVFLAATDELRFTAAPTDPLGTATLTFKAWDGKAVSLDKDDLTVTIV
jgi:hypothetical protein